MASSMRWMMRVGGSTAAILVVVALAFLAGKGGASGSRHRVPETVQVSSYAIPHFKRGTPDAVRFGPFSYSGGFEMRGHHTNFGGLSAIRVGADGQRFLSVTDTGDWVRGQIAYSDGKPSGLSNVTIAPLLGPEGQRAKDMGLWDSESIAMVGNTAYVGVERNHAILAFDFNQDGLAARGRFVRLPEFVRRWPSNRGIEAMGTMPESSAFPGRLIGLSERSSDVSDTIEGFVLQPGSDENFRFYVKRSDGFDITALDFLPGGDLVLLERFFSPLRGVAMRLRRIKTDFIKPEAIVDGEVLLVADGGSYHVDNMEGLSIHKNSKGETVFTLLSDDNFSVAQRILLLQFRWLGD
ncbi:MAG: esterase-like activity of phytase family protein [Beijerinckiaceae bacterium]